MARRILESRKGVNKQIFMITDGKPSAIREHGRLYKNPFGLDPKIVNLTLQEAAHCRKKRITITTFMLAADGLLLDFVRKLTELNHGSSMRPIPLMWARMCSVISCATGASDCISVPSWAARARCFSTPKEEVHACIFTRDSRS